MTSREADMEANKAENMVAVETREAMVGVDNRTSMDLDVSSREAMVVEEVKMIMDLDASNKEAMEVVEMNMDLVARTLAHVRITS